MDFFLQGPSLSGGRLGDECEHFLLDVDAVLVEPKSMQSGRSCWNEKVISQLIPRLSYSVRENLSRNLGTADWNVAVSKLPPKQSLRYCETSVGVVVYLGTSRKSNWSMALLSQTANQLNNVLLSVWVFMPSMIS